MRIYFISPIGYTSPGLFESFVKTFKEQGHIITENINEADWAFFDSHCGCIPYDWSVLTVVLDKKLPVIYFDAFDYWSGGDVRSDWFGWDDWKRLKELALTQDWAKALKLFMDTNILKVYFMRKISKGYEYDKRIHPLEYCQFKDHDFPITTKDELCSRPYDVCFIGAASPWRANLVAGLLKDGRVKVNYFFPFIRIEHNQWLNEHRKAKFFITADGGGFGDERPYQLMTIAPMLRGRNDQLINNNWVNGIDCIEVGDVWGSPSSDDIKSLCDILSDNDRLYDIYLKGVDKMKKYFSEEYRSLYVLDVINQNK